MQSVIIHEIPIDWPRPDLDEPPLAPPIYPEAPFDQRVSMLAADIREGRINTIDDIARLQRTATQITALPGVGYVNHSRSLNQQDAELVWSRGDPKAWILDDVEAHGLVRFEQLFGGLTDEHDPGVPSAYLESPDGGPNRLTMARQWMARTLDIDPRQLDRYTLDELARRGRTRLKLNRELRGGQMEESAEPEEPEVQETPQEQGGGQYRGRHRLEDRVSAEASPPEPPPPHDPPVSSPVEAALVPRPRRPKGQSIFEVSLPFDSGRQIRSHRAERSSRWRRLALAVGVVAFAGATVAVGLYLAGRNMLPWQHDPGLSAVLGNDISSTALPDIGSTPPPQEVPPDPATLERMLAPGEYNAQTGAGTIWHKTEQLAAEAGYDQLTMLQTHDLTQRTLDYMNGRLPGGMNWDIARNLSADTPLPFPSQQTISQWLAEIAPQTPAPGALH